VVVSDDLIFRLRGAEQRLLPRLATLVENDDPSGLEALRVLYPLTGRAHVVGVTGRPGAGKSTLVAAMMECIRASDRRVAVIAVDPSSTLTGGAVLGDRIRMMERHADDGVFVRSMASRGRQGGLAWATAGLVHLLDAAGYPLVVVETVGTGQDGTDIASLADTVVVVEAPDLGDSVQTVKSGLLEIGDIVIVNKADQPGADEALRLLRAAFDLVQSREPQILSAVATAGVGVPTLLAAIDAHFEWLTATGQLVARRERAARSEVLAGLRAAIDRRLEDGSDRSPELARLISQVAGREMSPGEAVETLTGLLTSSLNS
jgi:LAO/AO transport system kinase